MRKLETQELNRIDVDEFKQAKKYPVVIVLDNIRSQNNIGSVFRTSDAFRAEKIILTGICSVPPHREIHKTALGAEDSVDWEYIEDSKAAVQSLKDKGYKIVAVEQVEGSTMLNDFRVVPGEKYALVLGNEVKGVSDDIISICDSAIEIPQEGTKHSLNISVSAGIVIWELFRQMR